MTQALVATAIATDGQLAPPLREPFEGLWDWDWNLRENRVRYSPRFHELLGYAAGEPTSVDEVAFHPEDASRMRQAMRRHLRERTPLEEEFRLRCKGGGYKWFRGRGQATWDETGSPLRITGSITDISAYKESEQRLRDLAQRDAITNLPDRRLFLDRVSQGIAGARRFGRSVAVLFVDLDRFKQVNDVFGYEAGNNVLREAGDRIHRSLAEEDAVSRLGGDEFAVLLCSIDAAPSALATAERIRAQLSRPFPLAEGEIYVSASIGIAVYPHDGESGEQLLKHADVAMSDAKRCGGDGHRLYSPDAKTRISRNFNMESRLRRALENAEMALHYQPQVNLASGEINSVEALLRWTNPDLGRVPPAQFIPLAEQTGLIHPIGAWVLETACAQSKVWQAAGLRSVRMCVNVSPRQLNARLVETVSRVLEKTGLSPCCIELEITESATVNPDPGADTALRALQAIGVGFAIDDFGTGYAMFDCLKRFPVRTLKVDRSFVRGVCDNDHDVAIVAASVSLAHSLGLRVVAEGIETAKQHARLKELGCDDCQGYHVCRPLPGPILEKFLASKDQAFPTDVPDMTIAKWPQRIERDQEPNDMVEEIRTDCAEEPDAIGTSIETSSLESRGCERNGNPGARPEIKADIGFQPRTVA